MSANNDETATDNLYAKPHVYFLVPYNVDTDAEVDELGAMLRLGEYSDVEKTAEKDGYIDEYYPEQHIDDAGAAGKDSTAIAAGEKDYAKGILLACDGRLLLKTRGKMYADTADYHRRTRGTYKLVIDNTYTVTVSGDVSITSTKGDINVTASAGDVVVESGTNKDITLRAGTSTSSGATGMIYEYSKGHYKQIDGHEYKVSETENTFTTGTSSNFYFGAKSTVNGDADSTVTIGASATIKPLLNVAITGIDVSFKAVSTDLKNVYCAVRGIQTSSQALRSEIDSIKSDLSLVETATRTVISDTNAVHAETRSIKSTLGNLQADVQNLIFFT